MIHTNSLPGQPAGLRHWRRTSTTAPAVTTQGNISRATCAIVTAVQRARARRSGRSRSRASVLSSCPWPPPQDDFLSARFTFQPPLATSLPLPFSSSDHEPVAASPSNVASSTTSAAGSGVKSYFAVIFAPANETDFSVAVYSGSPVTDTLPVNPLSLSRSSVSSNPPPRLAPSHDPDQTPTNFSPAAGSS